MQTSQQVQEKPVFEAWKRWIHEEYSRGISVSIGKIKQQRIASEESYLDLLDSAAGSCYITNHVWDNWNYWKTTKQNPPPRIFRIPFDLDISKEKKTTFEDVYFDYRKICQFAIEQGLAAQGNFSGSKGFHVYLFMSEEGIRLQHADLVLREFFNGLVAKLGLITADRKTTIDLMRIIRVPLTRHEKSGLYCLPIFQCNDGQVFYDIKDLGEIFGYAAYPTDEYIQEHPLMIPNWNRGLGESLLDLDKTVGGKFDISEEEEISLPMMNDPSFDNQQYDEITDTGFVVESEEGMNVFNFNKKRGASLIGKIYSSKKQYLYPCLEEAWKKARNGQKPHHDLLFAIVIYYKRLGKTRAEVKELFESQLGHNNWFNKGIVDSQLDSIYDRGYERVTGCRKLRDDHADYCLEEKCFIYRKWVKNG